VAGVAFAIAMLARQSPLQQARAAVERGDGKAELHGYEAHLQQKPDDDQARWEYAQLLVTTSSPSALDQLRRVSAMSAHRPAALRQIAALSLRNGDNEGARVALLELEQVSRDDFAVPLSLAELFFQSGEFDQALARVQRSLELRSDRAESHVFLADILDELGRTEEMIEPLRRACELQPEHYTAHVNLAYACLFAGDLECAEREARWCLKRNPQDASVYRMLAKIARDRGEHQEALRQIGIALTLDPADLESRLLEADILLFQNQAEAAYLKLKPLASSPRDRRRILATLIRAAQQSGRSEEATGYQAELRKLAAEDRLTPHSPGAAGPLE
jgi:Flp pilus assembly protein TadD